MSRGVNKVILIGNCCADPEVRYSPSGAAILNVTVATNESWVDKATQQKQEKAEFHRVVMFGKLAEIGGQYLKKGSSVYLEGKLKTNKWQDQSGADRYTTEVVLDFDGKMQMLDSKQDNQQQTRAAPQQQQNHQGYHQPPQGQQQPPAQQQRQQQMPPQGAYDPNQPPPF